MDLTKIPLFRIMSERMSWLTQRQEVLAQNVANADTPGYKPRDLEPLDFRKMAHQAAQRLSVRATRAGHIVDGESQQSQKYAVKEVPDHAGALINGNSVVLEEELMKVASTAMDYQLTTSLYRKHIGMIKTALGVRG